MRDGVGIERCVSFRLFSQKKALVWSSEPNNLPVLIRRGALGENSPNADLCLTALHPVYVDGFLMPIGDLVNGTSITFESADGRDTIDFFNIELESHDILDAGCALRVAVPSGDRALCPAFALHRWPQQASLAPA
jgi:hypothetical protein